MMTDVASLAVGDHACAFYRGSDERDELLRSFLSHGVETGEGCACVLEDPTGLPDLFEGAGAVRTLTTADYYLAGGSFDPVRAAGLLPGLIDTCGTPSVRVTGEVAGWFERCDVPARDLLHYETLVGEAAVGQPATMLCLYDLDVFDPALVGEVVRRHTAAVGSGVVFRPFPDNGAPADLRPSPGEVTRDLLDGRFDLADAGWVAGVDLLGHLRAAVVRVPDNDRGALRRARASLAQRGVSLVAARAGEVAMVLPAGADGTTLAETVRAAVPGAVLGLGAESVGPAGCARSYVEAGWSADLARKTGRALVGFEDLGVLRLMAAGPDPRAAEGLVAEWLGDLVAHDESRNAELLNTLAVFLDSGGSYAACADALGIHVSTLRYRLKRVADITGHDLADAEVRFNLQLAMRANSLLHVLEP